jgi:hypothetical protein
VREAGLRDIAAGLDAAGIPTPRGHGKGPGSGQAHPGRFITNGFPKKFEPHCAAIALHVAW